MRYVKSAVAALMVFAMLGAAACANMGGAPVSNVKQEDLLHHTFVLKKVDGLPFKSEKEVSIEFGEGMHITGAVCNRFMGKGELTRGKLFVKQMASTQMMCLDDLNKLEYKFSQMLVNGADLTLEGNILTLKQDTNTLEYELRDRVN